MILMISHCMVTQTYDRVSMFIIVLKKNLLLSHIAFGFTYGFDMGTLLSHIKM